MDLTIDSTEYRTQSSPDAFGQELLTRFKGHNDHGSNVEVAVAFKGTTAKLINMLHHGKRFKITIEEQNGLDPVHYF